MAKRNLFYYAISLALVTVSFVDISCPRRTGKTRNQEGDKKLCKQM